MMPEMNGFELCKNIKGNILTSLIPFIILSAKNTIDIRMQSWAVGVDLFDEKPFNSQLLLARIANLLNNRKLLKYKYQIAKPVYQHSEERCDHGANLDEKFLAQVNEAIEKF